MTGKMRADWLEGLCADRDVWPTAAGRVPLGQPLRAYEEVKDWPNFLLTSTRRKPTGVSSM